MTTKAIAIEIGRGSDSEMKYLADEYSSIIAGIKADYERGRLTPEEYIRQMKDVTLDTDLWMGMSYQRYLKDRFWPEG